MRISASTEYIKTKKACIVSFQRHHSKSEVVPLIFGSSAVYYKETLVHILIKCASHKNPNIRDIKAMVAGLAIFILIVALLVWLGGWNIVCAALFSAWFCEEEDNHGQISMRSLQDENDGDRNRAVQSSENQGIQGHQERPEINSLPI